LRNYEKRSFYKIFLGYFISASLFILLLGFLYNEQHKTLIMQKVAMNMHQYVTKLKQTDFAHTQDGYSYDAVVCVEVENQLPQKRDDVYYKAFSNQFIINIDAKLVDKQLNKLSKFTIFIQILMISIFFIISYVLAKKSIKPMVEMISHLDLFISDLIHDINTPISSIIVNSSMLKRNANESQLKKIDRIEESAHIISALYENLEIVLNETTLKKEDIELKSIILTKIDMYKNLYPNIKFECKEGEKNVFTNNNAIARIIDNILSNACKYSNDDNPIIQVYFKDNTLHIKDNGKGIKYPHKVFQRKYKENESGHGVGMHIVHRLCVELSHEIKIDSQEENGTTISIKF